MFNEKASPGRRALVLPRVGAEVQKSLVASWSWVRHGTGVRGSRQVASTLRQRFGLLLPGRTVPPMRRGRALVAQAMKVVMADCHCSADEAYSALLDTAREMGRGLTGIARDVVDSTAPLLPPATDFDYLPGRSRRWY